jgi:hypothetical protein
MNGTRQPGAMILAGTTVLLLALLSAAAAAQEPAAAPPATSPTSTAPTLVVESSPPGAVVTLRGPYEWTGVTPWRLYRDVHGLYRVEARLPGYETWSGDAVLGPGGVSQLQIKLGRRTLAKVLLRSAVIPGWGQVYRGQKAKGALFLVGSVVAAGGVCWAHEAYRDDVDDFDSAKRAYEQATRLEDLPALYEAVRHASDHADRGHERRTLALAVLGGIYGLNLLDCVVFAPSGEVSSSASTSRAEAPAVPDAGSLGWLADVSSTGSVRAGLRLRWN